MSVVCKGGVDTQPNTCLVERQMRRANELMVGVRSGQRNFQSENQHEDAEGMIFVSRNDSSP
jgi:hypothetical protein